MVVMMTTDVLRNLRQKADEARKSFDRRVAVIGSEFHRPTTSERFCPFNRPWKRLGTIRTSLEPPRSEHPISKRKVSQCRNFFCSQLSYSIFPALDKYGSTLQIECFNFAEALSKYEVSSDSSFDYRLGQVPDRRNTVLPTYSRSSTFYLGLSIILSSKTQHHSHGFESCSPSC